VTGAEPARGSDGPTVSFGFNLAKVADHGEDSDPILRDGPDVGLAAVFDGMGGAGGTVYETADGPRSGAYLSSRIVRTVVEDHLLRVLVPEQPLPGATTAAELHDLTESALQSALADLRAPTSRLRSRLLRALPTTMALAVLQRAEPAAGAWACQVLWAGDSRVYVFTPNGMQQLTTDDIRDDGDAMANLQRDSVISNALSADTEFTINHRRVLLEPPFFVVCATDGCFGYLRSPMHFEALVLRALDAATDDESWSAALQHAVSAVTGDDASMATIAVGADLGALQQLFRPRLAEVTEQYVVPMDALVDQVAQAEEALAILRDRRAADTVARWDRYRDGYEGTLRHGGEPDADAVDEAPRRDVWNPPKRITTEQVPVGDAQESRPATAGGDADTDEGATR
jgi:serine/threonine protein phosphatase PrpC